MGPRRPRISRGSHVVYVPAATHKSSSILTVAEVAEMKMGGEVVVLSQQQLELIREPNGEMWLRPRVDDDADVVGITSHDLEELVHRRHVLQDDTSASDARLHELEHMEEAELQRRRAQSVVHQRVMEASRMEQRLAIAVLTSFDDAECGELISASTSLPLVASLVDGVQRIVAWLDTEAPSSSSSSSSSSMFAELPRATINIIVDLAPWEEAELLWSALVPLTESDVRVPHSERISLCASCVLCWVQATLRGWMAHQQHVADEASMTEPALSPVMMEEMQEHREFLQLAEEELRAMDELAEEVLRHHNPTASVAASQVLAVLPDTLLTREMWCTLTSSSTKSSMSTSVAQAVWKHLHALGLGEQLHDEAVAAHDPTMMDAAHVDDDDGGEVANKLHKLQRTPRLRTPRMTGATPNNRSRHHCDTTAPSTSSCPSAELLLLREELAARLEELHRVQHERDGLLMERHARRHLRPTSVLPASSMAISRSVSHSPGRGSGIVEELEEQLGIAHQRILEMERRGESVGTEQEHQHQHEAHGATRAEEALRDDLRKQQCALASVEVRLGTAIAEQRHAMVKHATQQAELVAVEEQIILTQSLLTAEELAAAELQRRHKTELDDASPTTDATTTTTSSPSSSSSPPPQPSTNSNNNNASILPISHTTTPVVVVARALQIEHMSADDLRTELTSLRAALKESRASMLVLNRRMEQLKTKRQAFRLRHAEVQKRRKHLYRNILNQSDILHEKDGSLKGLG